ncbi:uncharacterized protein LOC106063440 isoform X3 [Biomphalaria glabrata]|uniref:cysteine dioxygenase n=1 Tax=Biomphalaria glabrata TaxID=6526 RepID=A0A9W2ZM14_BIOGL|nr:uncharacterized protein LOC106063440 isoform X2 [Biomphalaria glabrata]XP_055875967.1 uncharacterized protein LOC106063440 isoform X3 [Biomphalaria glabrata]
MRVNTITTIEDLIHHLRNIKSPKEAYEVLKRCKLPRKEWLPYAYYQPESKYSRNLIHLEDNLFELFLICWAPGQGNEPHRHCGSYCFFQVLQGELCETLYQFDKETSNDVYKVGKVSQGIIPVGTLKKSESHKVINNHFSSWAVSLHVYLKPTDKNKCVRNEETIELTYVSEYRKLLVSSALLLRWASTIETIDDLIDHLQTIEEARDAHELLERCNIPIKEWIPYAFYKPSLNFSRNLIHEEVNGFELLLICWKPGQGNQRHNHCGSYCFMHVLHGELREILYRAKDSSKGDENVYRAGKVSWGVVAKESEWHEVKNNNSSSWAVSLHVYVKPIKENKVPSENEPIKLEYVSLYSKPNSPECLPLNNDRGFQRDCAQKYHRLRESDESSNDVQRIKKDIPTREKLFLIMAVISLGMALVALILVSLTISNINKQENMVSSKSRFEKICLNCSLLSLPTGDTKERRIIITDINGFKDQCCAENELELSILLDLISNVSKLQTDADISILEKGKLPISAHKSCMQTNEPGQDSNDTHIVLNVDPLYNDPAIEHNSGVDLVPDGLKIIYTGIYFVYSSIEFQNAQTVSVNSTHYHYIHRISPGNPSLSGVLLRMVLSVDKSSSPIRETTYAGGVFYLQSGDLIQICLSSPTKINKNSSSFIGLILLSTN